MGQTTYLGPKSLEIFSALPQQHRAEIERRDSGLADILLKLEPQRRVRYGIVPPPRSGYLKVAGPIIRDMAWTDFEIAGGADFPGLNPKYAATIVGIAKGIEAPLTPQVCFPGASYNITQLAIALTGFHGAILGDPGLLTSREAMGNLKTTAQELCAKFVTPSALQR